MEKENQRKFGKSVAVASILIVVVAAVCFAIFRNPRPNVILIVIDTLRKDFLTERNAPNLTKLSEECVSFENAFSPSPWTIPAHASLFTGLLPSKHHVISDMNGTVDIATSGLRFNALEDDYLTLAERLKENGYATFSVVGNFIMLPATGFVQGFDTYSFSDKGANAEILNKEIFNILESAQEPFFLFINYFDPHEPYSSPESKINSEYRDGKALLNYVFEVMSGNRRVRPEEIRFLSAIYGEEVQFVDKHIGRLMDRLKQKKLYDNSLIIITSDHGEHMGENNLFLHGCSLDDPLVHVPLMVKFPRSVSPKKMESYVELTDIMPTILDECGISYAKDKVDGQNLMNANHEIYAELHPMPVLVRLNRERFNKHSVLKISTSGVRSLEVKENLSSPTIPAKTTIQDPETIETLRSLGYIF